MNCWPGGMTMYDFYDKLECKRVISPEMKS